MDKKEIIVKNKDGNVIAVFTNENLASKDDFAIDVMVAPTITLVSNGESTLSFQMLSESPKWKLIKDIENTFECNGREYTYLNSGSIIESGHVVNVTLVETWYLLKKVYLSAYNVNPEDDPVDIHTVKILPRSTNPLVVVILGVLPVVFDDSEVTDSRGVLMPRGSAGYALWAILRMTKWKLGICDQIASDFDASTGAGCYNIETDMKSVLYNIQYIQQQYGGILCFDSKNKLVHLRSEEAASEFNTWKGYSIRRGKNLDSTPTIIWDNDITTVLNVLGNDNSTFSSINDGFPSVSDYSFTNTYYEGYIQNQNIFDTGDDYGKQQLLSWGKRKVKELSRPRKTVSYSIMDIRGTDDTGESDGFYEDLDINDIVKAYYTADGSDEETEEELRIVKLQYNYFFPGTDSVIEVGDKFANVVESVYDLVKKEEEGESPWLTALKQFSGSIISVVLTGLIKLALQAVLLYLGIPVPVAMSASATNEIPQETAASQVLRNIQTYSSETSAYGRYREQDLIETLITTCEKLIQDVENLKSRVDSLEMQLSPVSYSTLSLNAEATDSDVAELRAYIDERIGDLGTNADGTPKTVKQYVDEKIAELNK